MTEIEIKQRIIELFQEERQRPGKDFDESRFLDYLAFPAYRENGIKGTFRGARRYYRFMDRLELEFGICFSYADLDNYYSVDRLTKKVNERIKKRRGNIMILQKRNEEKDKYIIEIVIVLILPGIYYWLGFHWISITLTFLLGIAFYWILSSRIYNRRHLKKLNVRILGKEDLQSKSKE